MGTGNNTIIKDRLPDTPYTQARFEPYPIPPKLPNTLKKNIHLIALITAAFHIIRKQKKHPANAQTL